MDSQMYPGWVTVVIRQIAKDGLTLCADKYSIRVQEETHKEQNMCYECDYNVCTIDDLK